MPPDSGDCIEETTELIKSPPREGAVGTGDAAFTTKAIAKVIRERGPTPRAAIKRLMNA